MRKSLRIKDLPKFERPREKLVKYGPIKLTNSELLAIIIGTGKKNENALRLSGKIIKKIGTKKLAELDVHSLIKQSGLGIAKACRIVAGFELGQRLLKNEPSAIILSPKNLWEEMRDLKGSKKEHFVVFFLNSRNREITREVVSIGSINKSLIHPREVFESAIKNLASGIIISHNHPSCDPYPSKDDLDVTKRLKEAGEILGIKLVDHVIVTKNDYCSLKGLGLL